MSIDVCPIYYGAMNLLCFMLQLYSIFSSSCSVNSQILREQTPFTLVSTQKTLISQTVSIIIGIFLIYEQ